MSLTSEQEAAVTYGDNLLLIACPGSGKTRTLVAKLVKEIEAVRDTPRAIACITYTNSAVQEIEERISYYLQPGDGKHVAVSTIHSFCLNYILRPFAWRLPGFTGIPSVLTRDKPEFEEIVRYALSRVNMLNPGRAEFEAFESLNVDSQGRLIGAAAGNLPVAQSARYFWERCDELGYVDFCNIVYRSFVLLKNHPDIGKSLSARFAWFLVDEFQDTTEIQTEILKLLYSTTKSRFFAVGDPAQSIFSFTGARPALLAPFAQHIHARTDMSLSGNFRSSPPIVVHAERLFPRAPAMQSVGATQTCTIPPEFAHVYNTFDAIRDTFLPRLQEHGIPYGEATILARDWGSLYPLSRRLREHGVPIVGPGARPYRRSRLFAMLAEQLCGAITDPQPNNMRQLERALYAAIQDATGQSRLDVFSFEGRVAVIRLLREARALATTHDGLAWLDAMSARTGEILTDSEFIDQTRAGLFYASVQEMKADMTRNNVDLASLSVEDLGLFASPTRALRLSTIHYAKGREYDAVAMIGVKRGTLPFFRATDIEDEKRLFYVGVTRPRKYLLYVADFDKWGNPPSQFLGPSGVGMLS